MEMPDFFFSSRPGPPARRSGSALVIVLGMLSVMMLMAVAFSTFMRVERGATTNLKNSHVAEQSLHTAVALAIQSIEDSFAEIEDGNGKTVVDSPAAIWPNPWIASCDPDDREYDSDPCFQSRRRQGTGKVANILTAEMADHLSSNQIAMIRSADVGWAPIFSGIGASSVFGEEESRYGYNAGYPEGDSIVGRFAFVALDTTGYLDIGKIGEMDKNDRKASTGGDPSFFIPPDGRATGPDGSRIDSPFKSGGVAKLAAAVSSSGAFLSYADAKRANGAGLDMKRPSEAKGVYMPPDLYSGSAVSLEPLTPEGEPKIPVPSPDEVSSMNSKDVAALARRAFPAMMGMFARSRKEGGVDNWQSDDEKITLFGGHPTDNRHVELSKAALATVGLLDAVDADAVPGESVNPGHSHWDRLKAMNSVSVKVDGRTVADSVEGDGDPLNYPCTESAPLMQMFYAYVTVDDDGTESYNAEGNPAPAENDYSPNNRDSHWIKTYNCTLHAGAKAMNQNRTDARKIRSAVLEAEFDVMTSTPNGHGVVSKARSEEENVYEALNLTVARGRDLAIEWKDFFANGRTLVGRNTSLDDSTDGQEKRKIAASGEFPFTVVCGAKRVETPGVYGENGDNVTPPKIEYYPLTAYEHYASEGEEDKDVWVPVRFKAVISTSDGDIQQVPAPALDDAEKTWWVRVDMGVYHNKQNSVLAEFDEGIGGQINGSEGTLAAGWAVCLAPQFGMDTTSLATSAGEPTWNAPLKVWLNNVCAHAGFDFGGRGARNKLLEDAATEFDDPDDVDAEFLGEEGGRRGGVFSTLQTGWLFDNEAIWSQWFNEHDTSCADLMHKLGKDEDDWFVDWKTGSGNRNAVRRNSELFTRLPSSGVRSVADLGAITIGPYETLSLFKTWRPFRESGFPESDFHRVMDYFTMDEDRYPNRTEISANTGDSGVVDWKKLGDGGKKQLFSAIDSGRVNLNLPRLLEPVEDATADKVVRVAQSDYFNPYPLAAALNGAPYPVLNSGTSSTNGLTEATALEMASAYAAMLSYADKHPTAEAFKSIGLSNESANLVRLEGSEITRAAVRDTSFFASAAGANSNGVLQAFMEGVPESSRQYLCDYMREGALRGVADAFTTRGQSFLVAIRADAYTSRFGMEDDPSEGSTLASTHALVELFRDPEPARLPDGTFPLDKDGNPVLYHNWMIRSFRMF